MIYWFFFIVSLMSSGYYYFQDSQLQYTTADINSAISYFDNVRTPLAYWRENNTGITSEVVLSDLDFPSGFTLTKRNDAHFYSDPHGIYVAFRHPSKGIANALAMHYSASVGNSTLPWRLTYYHIGFKDSSGCLSTTYHYGEETNATSHCQRPLPAAINVGDLVITDGDGQA
ncbi:MAG: hypothetical protein ACRCZ6_17515 [Kluyvera sp.]|uniref:hypothetical protein n=1 Tax=Kluyvera sp. TaxID=1538228 RepID=UPI003F36CA86